MLDFFKSIISYIQGFWDFFTNTLTALIKGFDMIDDFIQVIFGVASHIPVIIYTSMLVVIAVAVVKFIIGRVGTSD